MLKELGDEFNAFENKSLLQDLLEHGTLAAASVLRNGGVGSLSDVPDPTRESMDQKASFLSSCMGRAEAERQAK